MYFEIILVICTRCIFNATLMKIDCPVQGQMLDFDYSLWCLSQFRTCYDSMILRFYDSTFFFFFNAQDSNRKGEKDEKMGLTQNFVINKFLK